MVWSYIWAIVIQEFQPPLIKAHEHRYIWHRVLYRVTPNRTGTCEAEEGERESFEEDNKVERKRAQRGPPWGE